MSKFITDENIKGGTHSLMIERLEDKKVGYLPLNLLPSYLLTFLQKFGKNAKDSLRAFPRHDNNLFAQQTVTLSPRPLRERARERGKVCNRRSNPIKHENNEIAATNPPQPSLKKGGSLRAFPRHDNNSFAKQTVTSLPSYPPALLPSKNKVAFTLAEVLITLGIIGVVAALTMPSLIQHHKKQEASARLKKFYSMMSQAIMLSENEHGAKTWEWSGLADIPYVDIDSKQQEHEDVYEYWNKYFAPYIKTVKVEKGFTDEEDEGNKTDTKVYFPDGSTLIIDIGRCMDIIYDVNGERGPNLGGKDMFRFFISTPRTFENNREHEMKPGHSFDVPYLSNFYKTRAEALTGCQNKPDHCSTLLMYDNWEFKSDYPHKL